MPSMPFASLMPSTTRSRTTQAVQFPRTSILLCIVHQIHDSVKYVGSKHQKEFLKDLKRDYGAVSKNAAKTELDSLKTKWGGQYPIRHQVMKG